MSHAEPSLVTQPFVDLVFDSTCPNVDKARALLRTGLARAGFAATWREWDRDSPETPIAFRGLGSPTILVNRRDISETGADECGACCRLYESAGQLRGVPPLAGLMIALEEGAGGHEPA